MKTNKAFTLIELLVVVLIIGILAAIAVLQYQKAVVKSRFATLKNTTKSIYEAELSYNLANGNFTGVLNNLDIIIPSNISCGAGGWSGKTYYVACYISVDDVRVQYIIWLESGKHNCYVATENRNHISHWLCQSETGSTNPQCDGGGCHYWIPQ